MLRARYGRHDLSGDSDVNSILVLSGESALVDVEKSPVKPAGDVAVMFSSIHPNTPVEVDLGKVHSLQKNVGSAN